MFHVPRTSFLELVELRLADMKNCQLEPNVYNYLALLERSDDVVHFEHV